MQENEIHDGIRLIVYVNGLAASVTGRLYSLMLDENPALAEKWRVLNREDLTARLAAAGRSPGWIPWPTMVIDRSRDLLREHPRYGYVAKWLIGWREISEDIRAELMQGGLTSGDIDDLCNAENARRNGGSGILMH